MHDAHNRNNLLLLIYHIKNQRIVYRHDSKILSVPRLFFVYLKSLQHIIKGYDSPFQPFKLSDGILNRLQIKRNIFENTAKIFFRFRCQSHIIIHTS